MASRRSGLARVATDVGVADLGVRNDADADISGGTDLFYTPKSVDSSGRAKVLSVEQRTVVQVTPTLDTVAYASGDVLFNPAEVTNAARVNGGVVHVESITLICKADVGIAFDLYLMDTNTSLGTINTAPNISDANAEKILGWVPFAAADYKDLGGVRVATIRGLNLTIKADAATKNLFIAAVAGGAGTFAASDMIFRLGIRQG